MRKAVAIALALAVQTGALSAPLIHAHPDGHDTGHHAGRAVHAHWHGHGDVHDAIPSNAPAVGTDDHDRAIFLNVFVGVAVSAVSAPAVEHEWFQLAAPVERGPHRGVAVAHGHDPPAAARRPSRAPPSRLS